MSEGDIEIAVEAAGADEAIDGIEETEAALEDAGDSMGETAGDMQDMQREMQGLGQTLVAGLAVVAGGILSQVPALREVASAIAAVFSAVGFQLDKLIRTLGGEGLVDELLRISNAIFEMEGVAGGLVGALAGLVSILAGLGTIIQVFQILTPSINLWAALAAVISGPVVLAIGLVIAGIALLAAAWATNFGGIRDITMSVFDRIQDRFNEFATVIAPMVRSVIEMLSGVWDRHGNTVATVVSWAFTTVGAIIEQILDSILTGVQFTLQVLTGDWEGALNTLVGFTRRTFGRLDRVFGGIIDAAFDWGRGLMESLVDGILGAIGTVADAIKEAAQTVRDHLPGSNAEVGPLTDIDTSGAGLVQEFSTSINAASGGGGGGGGQRAFNANRGGSPPIVRMDGRRLTQQDSRYRRDGTASRGRNG